MKNNKGFTITELLVIVAIMLTILGIAVYGYAKISEKQKLEARKQVFQQVEHAAEQYFSTNEYLKNDITDDKYAYVSVGTLVENDFLAVVTDPVTEKQLDNCMIVRVSKVGGVLEYKLLASEQEQEEIKQILGTSSNEAKTCKYEPIIVDPKLTKLTLNIYKSGKGCSKGELLNSKLFIGPTDPYQNKWDIAGWYNLTNAPYGLVVEFVTSDESGVTYSLNNSEEKTLKNKERICITDDKKGITINTKYGNDITSNTTLNLDKTKPTIKVAGNKEGWINNIGDITWTMTDETSLLKTITSYENSTGLTEKAASSDVLDNEKGKYNLGGSKESKGNINLNTYVMTKNYIEKIEDGVRKHTKIVCDNAGNCAQKEVVTKLDAVSPTVAIKSYEGSDNVIRGLDTTAKVDNAINSNTITLLGNNWTNKMVVVRSSAADNLSGISKLECIDPRDNSVFKDFRRIMDVTEGTLDFKCVAYDLAGNNSADVSSNSINKVVVNRDMTPPTLTVSAYGSTTEAGAVNKTSKLGYTSNTWYKGWAWVNAEAVDESSSVKLYYVREKGSLGGSSEKNMVIDGGRTVTHSDYSAKEGISIYNYYACDAANNCSPAKGPIVKLDRTAPNCGSVSGQGTANSWTKGSRTITQACTDSYSSYGNCQSVTNTFNYEAVTGAIKVKDAVGNENSCSVGVYIDRTAPTEPTNMSFVLGDWSTYNSGWTNKTVYAAKSSNATGPEGALDNRSSVANSGVSKYQISADGVNWVDYAYNWQDSMYAMSTQGTHTRYFRAVDKAGNAGNYISRLAYIDLTNPTCTSGGGNSSWTSGSRTLTASCSDGGGSGCTQSSKYFTNTINYEVNSSISPGRVYDNAGNYADCPAQVVKIDRTKPTISVSLADANGKVMTSNNWTNQVITANVTVSDTISGINTVNRYWNKSGLDYSNVYNGSYTWNGSGYTNGGTLLEVSGGVKTADNTMSTASVTVENGVAKTYIAPPTYSGQGIRFSRIVACDAAGNCDYKEFQMNIDKTKPICTLTSSGTVKTVSRQDDNTVNVTWSDDVGRYIPIISSETKVYTNVNKDDKPTTDWYSSDVNFSLSYSDDKSGVNSYGIEKGNYKYNGLTSYTHTDDSAGVSYGGVVMDNAGNVAKCAIKIRKDSTAPTIKSKGAGPINCLSSGSTGANSYGYSVKAYDALNKVSIRFTQYYTATYCTDGTFAWYDTSKQKTYNAATEGIYTIFARCSNNPAPKARFLLVDTAGNYVTGGITTSTASDTSSNSNSCKSTVWWDDPINRQ